MNFEVMTKDGRRFEIWTKNGSYRAQDRLCRGIVGRAKTKEKAIDNCLKKLSQI